MKLIYALRFLTILPIPWREGEDLSKVARSAALFPLAGLIMGIAGGTLLHFLPYAVHTPSVLSLLAVLFLAVLTGGLHLDGTGDLADGLGAGKSPENRLKAMKDSRIGTFGVLAILAVLGLKWAALTELLNRNILSAPLIVPAMLLFGRWLQVLLIGLFKNASPEGIGSFFKSHLKAKDILFAGFCWISVQFCLGGLWGLLISFAALSTILGAPVVVKKLGGLSGDVYGAFTEWGEAVYLWAAILLIPLYEFLPNEFIWKGFLLWL